MVFSLSPLARFFYLVLSLLLRSSFSVLSIQKYSDMYVWIELPFFEATAPLTFFFELCQLFAVYTLVIEIFFLSFVISNVHSLCRFFSSLFDFNFAFVCMNETFISAHTSTTTTRQSRNHDHDDNDDGDVYFCLKEKLVHIYTKYSRKGLTVSRFRSTLDSLRTFFKYFFSFLLFLSISPSFLLSLCMCLLCAVVDGARCVYE